MRRVTLGAGLIAQNPEGKHRDADGSVLGEELVDQRPVRGEVVGVELAGVHGGGTRGPHHRHLLAEPIGAAGGEHHRRPGCQSLGEFESDLAAAPENHHNLPRDLPWCVGRVLHGGDYSLR